MCQQRKWRINHANQSQYYANVFAGRVLRDPCVPTLDQRWNTECAAKCGAYWYKRHALYLHSATFHRNIVLLQPATTVKILLAHHRYSAYNPINQTETSVGLRYSAPRNRSTLCRRKLFLKTDLFFSGVFFRCSTECKHVFLQNSGNFHQPSTDVVPTFFSLHVSCWKKKRETILNVRAQTTRGIWIANTGLNLLFSRDLLSF